MQIKLELSPSEVLVFKKVITSLTDERAKVLAPLFEVDSKELDNVSFSCFKQLRDQGL